MISKCFTYGISDVEWQRIPDRRAKRRKHDAQPPVTLVLHLYILYIIIYSALGSEGEYSCKTSGPGCTTTSQPGGGGGGTQDLNSNLLYVSHGQSDNHYITYSLVQELLSVSVTSPPNRWHVYVCEWTESLKNVVSDNLHTKCHLIKENSPCWIHALSPCLPELCGFRVTRWTARNSPVVQQVIGSCRNSLSCGFPTFFLNNLFIY